MSDEATTTAPDWSVTLRGRAYPLTPSVIALRAIEYATGCTVFSLVEAGADGALTIDQLTVIAVCMADVPERDALFGGSQMMMRSRTGAAGRGPGPMADNVAGAIVEGGLMAIMPRLVVPLAAALAGRTNAQGEPVKVEG